MKIQAQSVDKDGNVESTTIGEPKPSFTAIIQEGKLLMGMSYDSSRADDGDGNEVRVYLWINWDWKVEYKGKEYVIPMQENINALIKWINSNEQEKTG